MLFIYLVVHHLCKISHPLAIVIESVNVNGCLFSLLLLVLYDDREVNIYPYCGAERDSFLQLEAWFIPPAWSLSCLVPDCNQESTFASRLNKQHCTSPSHISADRYMNYAFCLYFHGATIPLSKTIWPQLHQTLLKIVLGCSRWNQRWRNHWKSVIVWLSSAFSSTLYFGHVMPI